MDTKRITFEALQSSLLLHVNWRINNGEFTERGLARVLGISQPQMHNVRKGIRRLSVSLADRILLKLEVSVLDLIEEWEARARADPPNREMEAKRETSEVDQARIGWREDAG